MPLKRIMVIRHGEKPSVDGTVLGVTLEGVSNSDELSVRGWQRAGALVRFFAPADGNERAGIGRPESLFAQRQTDHVTSVRAPHTLGPLADFIGKPISTQFAKCEEELLAAALSAEAATVPIGTFGSYADIRNIGSSIDKREKISWSTTRYRHQCNQSPLSPSRRSRLSP